MSRDDHGPKACHGCKQHPSSTSLSLLGKRSHQGVQGFSLCARVRYTDKEAAHFSRLLCKPQPRFLHSDSCKSDHLIKVTCATSQELGPCWLGHGPSLAQHCLPSGSWQHTECLWSSCSRPEPWSPPCWPWSPPNWPWSPPSWPGWALLPASSNLPPQGLLTLHSLTHTGTAFPCTHARVSAGPSLLDSHSGVPQKWAHAYGSPSCQALG